MENKDQPVYPASIKEWSCVDRGMVGVEYSGLTKLEFFACNAPVDIPSWFVHVPPAIKPVVNPIWQTIANEDDRKHFINWMKDNEYGLPDHLKHYSEAYNKFQNEGDEWRKKDWAARYFQWRRYYAEQLLLELSKPQP